MKLTSELVVMIWGRKCPSVEEQAFLEEGRSRFLCVRRALLAIVLMPLIVSAASTETVNGITWSYTTFDGKATIESGSGYLGVNYTAIPAWTSGAIIVPSTLGGRPVTRIGLGAFYGCSKLTSVTIPSSVTSIGNSAFEGCSGLMSVTIPPSVTSIESGAFKGCCGLADQKGFVIVKNTLCDYIGDASVVEIPDGVTSIGARAFSDCSGLKSVMIHDCVKSIGISAFSGCRSLASVTIPEGVTSIGAYAFSNCSGLKSVKISSNVVSIGDYAFCAFLDCSGIVEFSVASDNPNYRSENGLLLSKDGGVLICGVNGDVKIPSSVTTIKGYAFHGCSGLTSVAIPSSVKSVGEYAFVGCNGIRSVVVPGRKCGIDFSSVTNLVIADGVTSVSASEFKDCRRLTSVTIPSSVTSIEAGAFSGCSGLVRMVLPFVGSKRGNSGKPESLFGHIFGQVSYSGAVVITQYYTSSSYSKYYIPSSLKSVEITDATIICDGAFYGCSGLTTVTIPLGTRGVGDRAFCNCSGLTSVTIPTSVTHIGFAAFYGCSGLKEVTISSSETSVGERAFWGCGGLVSVTIPSSVARLSTTFPESYQTIANVTFQMGVTHVGDDVLLGCVGLKSVTIPDGVTSIGDSAFFGCSGLTSVTIPPGVTNIGNAAFYNCSGLISAAIPASVMKVGDDAFSGCRGLTNVTITDGVKLIGDRSFCECSGLTSVLLPGSVTRIGESAFSGCSELNTITIPHSVISIGSDAFDGCAGLGLHSQTGVVIKDGCALGVNGECPEGLVIPEGVRLIADGAFRDGYELLRVSLPSTLKCIGREAFRGCTSLEYVELPEGLEDVSEGAFRDCTWMQEVEFPSSLTNIGKFAFANCTMLDGVECFDGLQTVGECAFSNCWRMLSVALPVTVDEIGGRAFYNCKSVLGVSVPTHVDTIAHLFPSVYQTLQSVAIAEGETELVASFFSGCKMLQEIVLSNAIQEIPVSTFEGCTELLRVWLPSELLKIGNRAFYGCGKLSSIEFPSGLISIGNSAFYGCGRICELKFPDGLVEIGADAFNGLPNVLGIVCPASVKKIGAWAFKGVWNDLEIKLPEGLETLGADAFANCASIRRIALPVLATPIKSAFPAAYTQIESVKILGQPEVILKDFCRDVTKLADIQIPASVTNIESYAFSGLSNLAGIELPSGLRTIGEYAFNGDSRLATIALPQSLESVGYRAFYGCSNVRSVSCSGELVTMSTLFPSAYTQITSVSINEGTTRLMEDLLSGCTKLSDIDLPVGVAEIGARAFKNCSALAAFGVPNGVVTLGNDVFYGCTGLTSLSLPEGLENIPSGAFQNCRAISSLVIPASVGYIGANAFSGCTALKSVSYLGSCPQFDSACYSGTPSDLSSYVVFGSRGWDGIPTSRTLPELWPTANARAITYWEPNTFEATFDGNGGTPSSAVVVQTTGMTYVLPEESPEILGARFDGWWTQPVNGGRIKSTTKVEVTRAQTFYAHWKYNGYSVRFDANGGIGEMEGQVMTVNTPVELAPNRYLRKGYRFEGWALSPDGEVAFADGEEVENLSFEHNAVVPLYAVWAEQPWDAADYLNVSGRAFAFDGDAEWVADDEVSHDGIGSMRSGVITAADEGKKTVSVMQTTVVGTGSGSFWWKVDCEPADGSDYFDYCAFSVDGTEVAKIAGTEDWGKVDYVVTGEGEHVLKWVFTRDDWDEDESLYENAAWVDEFEWAPTPVTLSFDAGGADGEVPASVTKYAGYEMSLPSPSMLTKDGMVFVGWSDGVSVFRSGDAYTFGAVDAVLSAVWEEKTWTLEEAVNITGLTIVTGGDANWTVDLDKNYDGVASIRSGVIGDDQQTWVSMDVEGSGTVAFRTFVSGEFYRGKKCDYLKFEVDGAEEFSSCDADWSNVVVKVSGRGTHTLKWTYLKNASKSAGDDCAWLDEIVWEADAETEVVPTIAELAEVFGGESDVVKGVKDDAQLAAFNQFLKDCAIASASDLSAGQKTWAYQSFKLSEVMTAPQLFEEEPVLKFDDIELNDGNLALTVSLHAGAEAITLAKDKLAEKIRVGASLDAIVETPRIIASPSTDGTSLTFTVAPPEGNMGFVRILIE